MKIKDFNFFGISPLFSWANTFKTQEFRQKIEYFQQHSKFCTSFIPKKFIEYFPSSYHENIRSQIFVGFRHFFSGLTPLKLKNFDQKLNISNNTQNFGDHSSRKSLFNTSLHHTIKNKISIFLGFHHFFRGLTH